MLYFYYAGVNVGKREEICKWESKNAVQEVELHGIFVGKKKGDGVSF
jgi:hypothetical protein